MKSRKVDENNGKIKAGYVYDKSSRSTSRSEEKRPSVSKSRERSESNTPDRSREASASMSPDLSQKQKQSSPESDAQGSPRKKNGSRVNLPVRKSLVANVKSSKGREKMRTSKRVMCVKNIL
ncbi:hypothetical protein QAD02_018631 [Eretmocerus hayati]|uniref:Uncharacterized protein n=1 Tax=Eretmocerus hayati TaxID=131215 RepID=A0ACC2PGX3_9HYME|nr:hypothetical protein QAD02_018631 [Eretmocerus hayati]